MKNESGLLEIANPKDVAYFNSNTNKLAPSTQNTQAILPNDIEPYYKVCPVKKELFYYGIEKKHDDWVHKQPIRLCNALEIIGHGFDVNEHGYCMVKMERPSRKKFETIALSDSEIGERENFKLMNGLGFAVSAGNSERIKLADYLLQGTRNAPRFDVLSISGWSNGSFVLPTGEIIGDSKRNIFFQGAYNLRGGFTARGSLESWNSNLCSLAKDNPLVMTSIAVSFAGAILELVEAEEGIGLHLYTETSSGKTTCADVAASVWGHPQRLKKSWDSTKVALSNSAEAANSMLLYLDEIGAGDSKKAGDSIYTMLNGVSRGRGMAGGGNEEVKTWLMTVISTGELGMSQFIEAAGKQVKGGQEIRMLDVPADGGAYKAFDCLHHCSDGAAFSIEIAKQARLNCGNAGRAFVTWLAQHSDEVGPWVTASQARLLNELDSNAAALVKRATRKFGIIAAALEMAGEAGATPFSKEESFAAVRTIWQRWSLVFGIGSRDDSRLLEQVIGTLKTHQTSRFMPLPRPNPLPMIHNLMGYTRESEKGTHFFVDDLAFKSIVIQGHEYSRACKTLATLGVLELPKAPKRGFKKNIGSGLGEMICLLIAKDHGEDETR